MKTLCDCVAVVTGAGSGIGRALAQELATHGAQLALADVSRARLAHTRKLLGSAVSKAYVVDVAESSEVEAFAREVECDFGRTSLLINNAGVSLHGKFAEVSLADMEWLFKINFWGVVHGCKFFLPLIRKEPEAHIVNLSSVFGLIGHSGQTAYCASKFAVSGFTESLRHELNTAKIGITCVYPAGVKTSISRNARPGAETQPGAVSSDAKRFEKLAPTTPEAAARAIVKGVLAGKPRILIGTDALHVDIMHRLMPVRAASLFAASLERRLSK
jgi:short-subunit dehydrogenase